MAMYSRLTTATAPWLPTSVPSHMPRAQNGSTPRMLITASSASCCASRRTPAATVAAVISIAVMMAPNAIAIRVLASSTAPGGTGMARLSRSRPSSRSVARATPKPNMAGPMIPNTPKVTSMWVDACGPPPGIDSITPNSR